VGADVEAGGVMDRVRDIGARPVRDLSLRDCVTLPVDATGEAAVEEMVRHERGAVVVLDASGLVVGIFTERDVLLLESRASVQGGADWRRAPLEQLMTPDPVTVSLASSIKDAIEKLREGGFRHLPVVDEDGKPSGLLSIRDILAEIAEYFPQEVSNLPPDPSLEASSPWGA